MAEPGTLLLGATGSLGGHVLAALLARDTGPATITAAGRNTARLAQLADAGFSPVAVDMSDTERVTDLVSRHTEVVLISGSDPNRLTQHSSVIGAAREAGMRHVYYQWCARR